MKYNECKRTVNSKPPAEIFDFLHDAEAMGLTIPPALDKWWEEETWGPRDSLNNDQDQHLGAT